jgi:hypothetical protein
MPVASSIMPLGLTVAEPNDLLGDHGQVRPDDVRHGNRGQRQRRVAAPDHQELWPNLGDDGLREAAYRGG